MATQRPSTEQSRSTRRDVQPREVIRYHLGGFAFVTPPTVVGAAYALFAPPVAMPLYFGGFLLALMVAFAFGIWLSDRVRGWDETDTPTTDN